ncbi:nuclear transport factor 2 family protein [Epilithonimonas hungarica]|uniref:SnoaL-like domain-containing protein n=1 Tax=Epilithonimonas hungarica TaxID=454006 RepID=A0A1G7SAU2_9FLAO|nr:nuclear transport factor 2 family protein [Epilithonimonas hungarica]SDG20177.1 hypothetical protein SAMN05421825_2924 [Epilithonimonas hungarica]
MADIEKNKEIVRKAAQYLNDRSVDKLLDLLGDAEGSWSIPFRSDKFSFGGFKDKAAFREIISGFLGGFSEFKFEIKNLTAEEDRVVMEAESQGKGPGSASYKNNYLLIFFIKNGKIHTVRERFDPFEVLEYVSQFPS